MRRTVVVVATAAALMTAVPIASAARAQTPLPGTNWVLTNRVSLGTPLDRVGVNAVFDKTRVTGSSGCNGYSWSYTTASVGKPALAGGWNVTGLFTGSAVQSPVTGSGLTLEFADDRASGNSGCNTFDGPVKVSGVDGIALGPFASTLKACADPPVSQQEQQYLAALGLARTYRVTGDELTLFRDGGTIAATFDRAAGLTSGS